MKLDLWKTGFNPLKPCGNYVPAISTVCNTLHCIYGFCKALRVKAIITLNRINHLIIVLVK
jgi:hypothetical protein